MPTGYTAGILDGKITTFPQFAKQCMRNFGALIHMRDDSMNAEYTPRTPNGYYSEQMEKAKQKLSSIKNLKDSHILSNRKSELEESKKYHTESLDKIKADLERMNVILKDIYKWQPPTPEHFGIRDFMINQINETIKWDCNTDYHTDALTKIESDLLTMNVKQIRKEVIESAKKDFEYYSSEYAKEVERCNKSNIWVEDFIKSL